MPQKVKLGPLGELEESHLIQAFWNMSTNNQVLGWDNEGKYRKFPIGIAPKPISVSVVNILSPCATVPTNRAIGGQTRRVPGICVSSGPSSTTRYTANIPLINVACMAQLPLSAY